MRVVEVPVAVRVSLLSRYAVLPRLAGTSFIPLALMARLPLAKLTLGTLTLVSVASSSYALGGLAAGGVGVGAAIGAPVLGWIADRTGQRRVVLIAGLVNAAAMAAIVAACYPPGGLHEPHAGMVLPAALAAGLTNPQVGPLARARWMALTESRPLRELERDAAFSYEGTADEVTFVLGPALVGALAAFVAPWLPLVVAALVSAVFVTAFALHSTAASVRPKPGPRVPAAGSRRPGAWAPVLIPIGAMLAMGAYFGGTQTALTAFAGGLRSAEAAGLLYSALGLTSAVAALSVAAWPSRFVLPARWSASAALLLGATLLLFTPQTLGAMTLVMLLVGIPVGPIMVTVYAIGGRLAPAGRVGTVMTALASGLVAGVALGAGWAGALAESGGPQSAYTVPITAAGVLLLLGVVVMVLRRGRG
ncbi:MFS transporter [Sinomonas sp. P10A9]|uniref:MFS transporter n=1 Tax=Sinomonas puerhi TaxID=3238584 RepID=A0AB39KZC9_9MICC